MAGSGLASSAAAELAHTTSSNPNAPPTMEAFLAGPALSLVKLSPSGKSIALVRRQDGVDQVIKLSLPDFTATMLYQTHVLPEWQSRVGFREWIDYLGWKSDDKLVATIKTPVGYDIYDMVEDPIHVLLDANGAVDPVMLNATVIGKVARINHSWVQDLLRNDPNHIMIGVRHDYYHGELQRLDIRDGSRVQLEKVGAGVVGFGTDREGNVITRMLEHDDGSLTMQGRAVGETKWAKVFDFRESDEKALNKYRLLGAGGPGTLYLSAKPESAADGDTEVVRTYDLRTKTLGPVIWSNPTYDVDSIIENQKTGEFLAGCYWVDTRQCQFRGPTLAANLKGLNSFFDGRRSLSIESRSLDDSAWIVLASGPDDPGTYFFYDASAHRLTQLGVVEPELPPGKLGHMRRMDFKARDGTALWAYVTDPPGGAVHSPVIVLPHGGPELRDKFEFDTWTQFLATRGYVVLQPNFRGSGGFGRKFAAAGYRQWGQRMHDDVMDAVHALIAEGDVDSTRMCIVGGSYGGYEAMYAAAAEPGIFRCAISVDGISGLAASVNDEKRFSDHPETYAYWKKAIGDPEADASILAAHSPISFAASWTTPLLLIHGDADDNVPVEQSRRMRGALERAGKAVRYVEIRNMAHGPHTDEEFRKVFTEMATFLAMHLGSKAPTADAKSAPGL